MDFFIFSLIRLLQKMYFIKAVWHFNSLFCSIWNSHPKVSKKWCRPQNNVISPEKCHSGTAKMLRNNLLLAIPMNWQISAVKVER